MDNTNENLTGSIPRPDSSIPKIRVGISNDTLQKLGIRHISASEAEKLLEMKYGGSSGLFIPFDGQTYTGADGKPRPYGRLRLDSPRGDMKYYQPEKSGVHNYILPDIALHNGDLLMVEGEFKAIALYEAGFPAIGTSGFYSWGKKQDGTPKGWEGVERINFEALFEKTLTALQPKRIVYVGDPDTALNLQFADAMVKLTATTKLPVALFRIEYAAPDGKGVDDIKGKLGDAKFKTWFQHGLDTAKIVPSGIHKIDLFFSLIERERHSLSTVTGEDQAKAQKRMVNSAVALPELQREKLSILAKELLHINKVPFKKAVREREIEEMRERRANRPKVVISNKGVLHDFCMIGEEFFSYSYTKDPVTKKMMRSQTMSICSKDYVHQSLSAAGYSSEDLSTKDTPVCGLVPNLSEFQSALYYLNATRCVGTMEQLYRPYGPTLFPDGSRYFNKSNVSVLGPKGDVKELLSDELQYTYMWLKSLFKDDGDLEHILSLLSYAYKAAYDGAPKKTRAVFLVGPPSSGKSFFIDSFVPTIFGQDTAADAHRLFKGEAGSSSVLASYVCKLSDKDVGTRADIVRVQNGMLSLLADFTTGGRLLYENVKTVEVINLFMLSSNPDGSVIKLLQGMPESVIDKICIYECEGGFVDLNEFLAEAGKEDPDEVLTVGVKHILPELPYFCSFLLNFNNEAFYEPRFGVCKRIPDKFQNTKVFSSKEEVVSELLQTMDLPFSYASSVYAELVASPSKAVVLKHIGAHEFVDILTTISEREPDLVVAKIYGGGKNRKFKITGKQYRTKHKEPLTVAAQGLPAGAQTDLVPEGKSTGDDVPF